MWIRKSLTIFCSVSIKIMRMIFHGGMALGEITDKMNVSVKVCIATVMPLSSLVMRITYLFAKK